MIRVKQDLDALDLTNRPQRLLSPTSAHEDDEEENFSGEDDAHECIPKVFFNQIIITYNLMEFSSIIENNI